jgi:hypothetical protein
MNNAREAQKMQFFQKLQQQMGNMAPGGSGGAKPAPKPSGGGGGQTWR